MSKQNINLSILEIYHLDCIAKIDESILNTTGIDLKKLAEKDIKNNPLKYALGGIDTNVKNFEGKILYYPKRGIQIL